MLSKEITKKANEHYTNSSKVDIMNNIDVQSNVANQTKKKPCNAMLQQIHAQMNILQRMKVNVINKTRHLMLQTKTSLIKH